MADIVDVGRHRLVAPAAAAQQETAFRQAGRGIEEELFDPCLAVGQPIGHEAEISFEARVRGDRVVGFRVQRIVDRNAVAGADSLVGVDHRLAAAIGEDIIEAGDQRAQGIAGIVAHARRGWPARRRPRRSPWRRAAASSSTPASSRLSNTPTPLALTITSASPPCSSALRALRLVIGIDHDAAQSGSAMSRCCWRSQASGSKKVISWPRAASARMIPR